MLAMMSIAKASRDHRSSNTPHASNHSNASGAFGAAGAARAVHISQTTGVPVEYLRKVLQRLTRARLIASERGRGGGFRLARAPERITLLHIVEAIEGPVDEAAFLGDSVLRGRCAHNPRLRAWRRNTAQGVRELLEAQSLADLVDE
jgi:Rrf2 family protein